MPTATARSVTKRSGILFASVHIARRVANVVRAVPVECLKVFFGKETAVGQHDKECLGAMALALDVVVSIGAMECLGADAEDAVIEDVQNVEAREIAPRVAGTAIFN